MVTVGITRSIPVLSVQAHTGIAHARTCVQTHARERQLHIRLDPTCGRTSINTISTCSSNLPTKCSAGCSFSPPEKWTPIIPPPEVPAKAWEGEAVALVLGGSRTRFLRPNLNVHQTQCTQNRMPLPQQYYHFRYTSG